MSEFTNSDGSGLVGGQLPSGSGQALQLDGSGNLKVAGSFTGSSASTAATGAGVPAQATYVGGNKAGNLVGLSLDSSGYLNVNVQTGGGSNASVGTDGSTVPGSSTQIGGSDGTNLQGALVESASHPNLRAALYNGANELAIDASGRLTSIIQAVAGASLAADQTNTILRVGLYGKQAAASDTALALDSSGRVQDNIAQWGGSAPSLSNPVITTDQIRNWINNGQGFSATTGKLTAAGSFGGLSLFNPNASGKTMIIFSLRYLIGGNAYNQINYTTSDPALGTAVAPVNLKAANGTASVVVGSSVVGGASIVGTMVDMSGCITNGNIQALATGQLYIIPANNGIVFYANSSTTWYASFAWVEI